MKAGLADWPWLTMPLDLGSPSTWTAWFSESLVSTCGSVISVVLLHPVVRQRCYSAECALDKAPWAPAGKVVEKGLSFRSFRWIPVFRSFQFFAWGRNATSIQKWLYHYSTSTIIKYTIYIYIIYIVWYINNMIHIGCIYFEYYIHIHGMIYQIFHLSMVICSFGLLGLPSWRGRREETVHF